MPEYGFSSADISSISNARTALSAGFMQLGQQIEKDITRIATLRETKAFASEMANLDPTQDNFPQQLIGTLSKYPLASQTNLAKQGIEVLGTRYKTAQEAKQTAAAFIDLGGGTQFNPKTGVAYRPDESGIPQFLDTTPQSGGPTRGTLVQTPDKQLLIDPTSGRTIQEFSPRPTSMRATNLNVLPENVKMQIKFLDEDADAVQIERQKLVDAITNGKISEDAIPAAIERQKQLEGQLQGIKDTRDKVLAESAAAVSARMGLPSGAGQGINGPSLMPTKQGNSSFVQMPNAVPNPAQMTQNTEDSAVLPDQLAVLPNVRPTVKQLSGPRLYRKVGGKMQYSGKGKELLRAIQQAYDDQEISEDEARQAALESGFRKN